MRQKSNIRNHNSLSRGTNHTNNDDTDNQYRKRLRSWKQESNSLKSGYVSVSPSIINDDAESSNKSTIYIYPINYTNDHQRISSRTVLSESLTTESAFYCPSMSYMSTQTADGLNNNHVTTSNTQNRKRKYCRLSCESFIDRSSHIDKLEMLPDQDNEKDFPTKYSFEHNLELKHTSIGNLPYLLIECKSLKSTFRRSKSDKTSTNVF